MVGALSQFFILSPRGDSVIFRDLRRDCPKNTTENFYRNVKFWGGKGRRGAASLQPRPPQLHLPQEERPLLRLHQSRQRQSRTMPSSCSSD